MRKSTTIPSEILNIFSENRRSAILEAFGKLLDSLNLDSRSLGGNKRHNSKLTNLQLFQIVVLLPFFAIKGFSHYPASALSRMFGGKKDMLYSFMAQDNIDWRNIIYRITMKLITRVTMRNDFKKSHLPSVLIADDSDLPKSGMRMESIGKIFSHVHQRCILGYKALMLCWSDGRTQQMIDASLHGERGKVEGKEQGLTAKQRAARFNRQRAENSHIAKRKEEYFMSKGEKLIQMVKRAIRSKVPFEYLLVDSWFTCTGLVEFVSKCHKPFHLLGMAKMGNTKYETAAWGNLSAKAIIDRVKSSKSVKYSKRYRCHYATIDVTLSGRSVRLFFCRSSKNAGWKVLLTTDRKLDFMRAYEIYSMRWAIEVFFSDSKRLLGLAECSAQDFASQISHISLVMIRYNLLASIKRFNDYETIGALFSDIYGGVHELTVIEQIWAIILEVVAIISELMGVDPELLIAQTIENETRLAALQEYAKTA
ncbi:MAG: transposase [Rikenellaceae bacterium]